MNIHDQNDHYRSCVFYDDSQKTKESTPRFLFFDTDKRLEETIHAKDYRL